MRIAIEIVLTTDEYAYENLRSESIHPLAACDGESKLGQ